MLWSKPGIAGNSETTKQKRILVLTPCGHSGAAPAWRGLVIYLRFAHDSDRMPKRCLRDRFDKLLVRRKLLQVVMWELTPRAAVPWDECPARAAPESTWPRAPARPWLQQRRPVPAGREASPGTQWMPAPGSLEFPEAVLPRNQTPAI